MATASQLFTDRDTVGAAYLTALDALRSAWIDVRKHDIACQSRRVLGAHPTGALKVPVYTFANASEWDPACLRHPSFAATPYYVDEWERAAQTAALSLITNVAG